MPATSPWSGTSRVTTLPAPTVDVVAGPDSYRRMPALLAEARDRRATVFDLKLDRAETYEGLSGAVGGDGVSGFVTIQRGCDKFCTFCVVPFTRGREKCRPLDVLLREVEGLAARGFREVELLGQNVNCYRDGEGHDLSDLLLAVAEVEGVERVRFVTSHPRHLTDRIVDAMAAQSAATAYVHGTMFTTDALEAYAEDLAHVLPMDDPRIASGTNTLLPAHLQGDREVLGPGEHSLPTKYAARRVELRIEPSIYLDTMLRDVVMFGGRIVIRKFTTPGELVSLEEPVIVNCTGLGARELFGDQELIPLKGQLTVLVPQPEIDYATTGAGRVNSELPGGGLHMMPRVDGIILGGTRERDVWTLEPNQEELKRVVEGHREFFAAMRPGAPAGTRAFADGS